MAVRKICSEPGCPNLQDCPDHRVQAKATRRRDPFYVSPVWVAHRREFKRLHPRCEWCGAPTVIVDHRQRRPRGAPFNPSAWDSFENLAAMCRRCDARKSAKYDGHLGNPLKLYPGKRPDAV